MDEEYWQGTGLPITTTKERLLEWGGLLSEDGDLAWIDIPIGSHPEAHPALRFDDIDTEATYERDQDDHEKWTLEEIGGSFEDWHAGQHD